MDYASKHAKYDPVSINIMLNAALVPSFMSSPLTELNNVVNKYDKLSFVHYIAMCNPEFPRYILR